MKTRSVSAIKYFLSYIYARNIKKSENYRDILFEAINDLGGIYIKLAQFIAMRSEFIPNNERIRYLSFYDKVESNMAFNDRANMLNELGTENLCQFSNIDAKPFAAGSFGRVYKAKLKSSENVVIKIKLSNIEKSLKMD